jgi:hypothetical protein
LIILCGVLIGFTTFVLGHYSLRRHSFWKVLIRYSFTRFWEEPFMDEEEPEVSGSSIQTIKGMRAWIIRSFTRKGIRTGDEVSMMTQGNEDQPTLKEETDISLPKSS